MTYNSEVGFHDRIVIQDLIKEVAQAPQINANAHRRFKGKWLFLV
jgi:hypothetical protein